MSLFIKPTPREEATFAKNDFFGRKNFGDFLMKVVKKPHNHEVVIGLDAQWGDGKTIFAWQWERLLKDSGFKHVVYYDAFAHDYHDQPLIPFVAEIFKLFGAYNDNDKELVKVFLTELLDVATFKILPNSINKLADQYLKFKPAEESHINKFKKLIEKLRSKHESENPIIFIIDELDRCKPSYAIKLLEVIKHLFAVPGIVFVLVVNSAQLRESIKHEYGNGVDAALYLNKFVNLWVSLPKVTAIKPETDNEKYIQRCFDELELDQYGLTVPRFKVFANTYNLSFREIERVLSQYKLIRDVHSDIMRPDTFPHVGLIYTIIIRTVNPELFGLILNKKATYEELNDQTVQQFKNIDSKIYDKLIDVISVYSGKNENDIIGAGIHMDEYKMKELIKFCELTKETPLMVSNFIFLDRK